MNAKLKLVISVCALGSFACASSSKNVKENPPATAASTAPAQPATPAAPAYPHTPDAEFRAQKPAPLPETPHFEAPVPTQRKLKNGLEVLIHENHALPLVVVELVVKTGVDGNPLSQPGLAEFTATMLPEGTKHRSAMQVAEQLENLAAILNTDASQDSTRVQLNCLTETLPQALDVMADVALNPAFKAADIDRVKKGYLTELAQRRAIPTYIAQDTAHRVLYGDKNPWGQPEGGTEAAVSKLTGKDLTKFHASYFVPQNALLSISGDVKPDEMMALLEKEFGHWKGKAPKLKPAPLPPEATARVIDVVDHPGSQSRVVVVHRMLTATSPDVVPMKTANYILGGLFSSRLNLNLREDKAYSYGVFSRLSFNDRTGVFMASGNMVAAHTADAVSEMEKEFARFADGKVTPEELSSAKSAYVRSLPSLLETNAAVASSMGTLAVEGLPLDYYAKLPDQVAAVTAQDVARVAQTYVKPASWPVVVVGPMSEQKAKLTALGLGPVQELPVPGAATGAPVHMGQAASAPVHK